MTPDQLRSPIRPPALTAAKPKTWTEAVERVSIDWPYKIELYASDSREGSQLRVAQTVNDRDGRFMDKSLRVITHDYPPPIEIINDPVEYLKGIIMLSIRHELDERVKIDGVRHYDPHTHDYVVLV